MKEQIDYSKLEFWGYDKSISASLEHSEGVLLFDRKVDPLDPLSKYKQKPSLYEILHPISVPKEEFDREFNDLERRIAKIENSAEFISYFNFDRTKLDELRERRKEMQRIKEQIKDSQRFIRSKRINVFKLK